MKAMFAGFAAAIVIAVAAAVVLSDLPYDSATVNSSTNTRIGE